MSLVATIANDPFPGLIALLLLMTGLFWMVGWVMESRKKSTLVCRVVVAIGFGVIGLLVLSTCLWPPRGGGGGRIAEARADINRLEAGLKDFKVHYGVCPPSHIVLHEHPEGWTIDPRSRGKVKRIWPRFDFTLDRDLNDDGDFEDRIELTGAECLVFFLGGVIDRSVGHPESGIPGAPAGFSKDPLNPFRSPHNPTESRDGPFCEFAPGRLVDVDDDRFCELISTLPGATAPIVYLSSNHGTQYSARPDPRVYPEGDERNLQSFYTRDAAGRLPYNLDSYQLINAGFDDLYGIGGQFDPGRAGDLLTGDREAERDNITNFSHGRLIDQ